jgi:hypothetical protein
VSSLSVAITSSVTNRVLCDMGHNSLQLLQANVARVLAGIWRLKSRTSLCLRLSGITGPVATLSCFLGVQAFRIVNILPTEPDLPLFTGVGSSESTGMAAGSSASRHLTTESAVHLGHLG